MKMKILRFILCVASVSLLASGARAQASSPAFDLRAASQRLSALESEFQGKIGVYALDTQTGAVIGYRENEFFPMQSTLKFMVAAAVLKKNANHLNRVIHYSEKDMSAWHPITGQNQNREKGMSLRALLQAAVSDSDNPAANILIRDLGGPAAVTTFARSIGNHSFTVSHYEGNLNSDPKLRVDGVTPKDMGMSLQTILLGNHLPSALRSQLLSWMVNGVTGYQRIRAGALNGWTVAEKTGSGDFGIANDIGVLWSPTCKPIVLAIYTVRNQATAKRQEEKLAQATQIILSEFAKQNTCFEELK